MAAVDETEDNQGSFVASGNVAAANRLCLRDGTRLESVWDVFSGHE